MRSKDSPTESPRRMPRRLSSHVLAPLFLIGLLAVLGATAATGVAARNAAIRTVSARAATFRDLSEASLRRTGKLDAVTPGARAQKVKLRVWTADKPLPGGRSVKEQDSSRVYTYTVRAKHGNRRLRVTVPAAGVERATVRAAAIALGAGALVLALLLVAVGGRLKRGATRPLKRLATAVELLAAGEPADVTGRSGAGGGDAR